MKMLLRSKLMRETCLMMVMMLLPDAVNWLMLDGSKLLLIMMLTV